MASEDATPMSQLLAMSECEGHSSVLIDGIGKYVRRRRNAVIGLPKMDEDEWASEDPSARRRLSSDIMSLIAREDELKGANRYKGNNPDIDMLRSIRCYEWEESLQKLTSWGMEGSFDAPVDVRDLPKRIQYGMLWIFKTLKSHRQAIGFMARTLKPWEAVVKDAVDEGVFDQRPLPPDDSCDASPSKPCEDAEDDDSSSSSSSSSSSDSGEEAPSEIKAAMPDTKSATSSRPPSRPASATASSNRPASRPVSATGTRIPPLPPEGSSRPMENVAHQIWSARSTFDHSAVAGSECSTPRRPGGHHQQHHHQHQQHGTGSKLNALSISWMVRTEGNVNQLKEQVGELMGRMRLLEARVQAMVTPTLQCMEGSDDGQRRPQPSEWQACDKTTVQILSEQVPRAIGVPLPLSPQKARGDDGGGGQPSVVSSDSSKGAPTQRKTARQLTLEREGRLRQLQRKATGENSLGHKLARENSAYLRQSSGDEGQPQRPVLPKKTISFQNLGDSPASQAASDGQGSSGGEGVQVFTPLPFTEQRVKQLIRDGMHRIQAALDAKITCHHKFLNLVQETVQQNFVHASEHHVANRSRIEALEKARKDDSILRKLSKIKRTVRVLRNVIEEECMLEGSMMIDDDSDDEDSLTALPTPRSRERQTTSGSEKFMRQGSPGYGRQVSPVGRGFLRQITRGSQDKAIENISTNGMDRQVTPGGTRIIDRVMQRIDEVMCPFGDRIGKVEDRFAQVGQLEALLKQAVIAAEHAEKQQASAGRAEAAVRSLDEGLYQLYHLVRPLLFIDETHPLPSARSNSQRPMCGKPRGRTVEEIPVCLSCSRMWDKSLREKALDFERHLLRAERRAPVVPHPGGPNTGKEAPFQTQTSGDSASKSFQTQVSGTSARTARQTSGASVTFSRRTSAQSDHQAEGSQERPEPNFQLPPAPDSKNPSSPPGRRKRPSSGVRRVSVETAPTLPVQT
eukprot:TRINITY_DN3460_c0_g1_i1.p1 TRINITY_DN3460_c0_g1~~TRINITY_DN3460_c0_g1_i1.p1  ORF type:complete len:966 (-),score=211.75 TRINITY_DN3460_c0_g1_i1:171-3068(-)